MKNNLDEVYPFLMDSHPFRLNNSKVIYRFVWNPYKGGYKENELSLKCERYNFYENKWTSGYLKLYSLLMNNIILVESIEKEKEKEKEEEKK